MIPYGVMPFGGAVGGGFWPPPRSMIGRRWVSAPGFRCVGAQASLSLSLGGRNGSLAGCPKRSGARFVRGWGAVAGPRGICVLPACFWQSVCFHRLAGHLAEVTLSATAARILELRPAVPWAFRPNVAVSRGLGARPWLGSAL